MKYTKTDKRRLAAYIALCLFALLALMLYNAYRAKIALLRRADVAASSAPTVDDGELEAEMQAAADGLETKDPLLAEGDVYSSDDVFNVLLIGTDERTPQFNENARGDSCMLLSINKTSGDIKLVSFECGMGVPILDGEYEGQYDWLTHTFRYGGADLMLREIRECFKLDVDRYIRVNFYTFTEGIDAIGGVDVELTQAEADYINNPDGTYAAGHISQMNAQDQILTVSPGLNHLNGATALVYARCRQIDNDWHRIERQRNVMQAAAQSVKDLSLWQLNDLLDALLPLVQTNLSDAEITQLLLLAPKLMGTTFQQATIPIDGSYGSMSGMGGRSLFAVDFQQNANFLCQLLYD